MSDDVLLGLLWILPIGGAGVVLLLPSTARGPIRGFSLGVAALTLVLGLVALARLDDPTSGASAPLADRGLSHRLLPAEGAAEGSPAIRVVELGADSATGRPGAGRDLMVRHAWIPALGVQYFLGLDGISLALVLLTGLVGVLALLASWPIDRNIKGYFSLFLMLIGCLNGVFLSLDLVLFYVFFEVMLLPMYFLIALWGGDRREYAALKFLLYTLFGSVFLLVAILILYFWPGPTGFIPTNGFAAHTFDAVALARAMAETSWYGPGVQGWIFGLFLVGFLVKLPSFPFHTWLPDAHVEAPTPISMLLAGVLLKIGGYGLVRFAWPLAPLGAQAWSGPVAALGAFSIVYGALAALAQTDFKRMVAYSSVSHMGYCTLGLAAMNLDSGGRFYAYGVSGAVYMMIAHGITSTGMFFLVGVAYERTGTRDLNKLGGLLAAIPTFGAIATLIFFASMGLPGLCGFVAEVFVILSASHASLILAAIAASAVVLNAASILWALQRALLGSPRIHTHHPIPDLSRRELAIVLPLAALTILLGVAPRLLLDRIGPAVDATVANMVRAEANAASPPVPSR